MSIDPYTACPGGTGKKVKFCCPDLLGELDELQRMLQGDQRLACLEQLERLDAKYPDRACLMSIRVMLEAQLSDAGKAEATVARFKEKYPQNPVALAEEATLLAMKQSATAAIVPLQQALAASTESMMPQVYDALAIVGEQLIAEGHYLAGRRHLEMHLQVGEARGDRVSRVLDSIDGSPEVHLLLKESQPLEAAPPDALWARDFEELLKKILRFEWLSTATELEALARKVGDWPAIWRNVATLRLWMADKQASLQALRKYSRQPLGSSAAPPLDDMVEAEALAQLFDSENVDYVDVITLTYPVSDFDQVLGRLSSSPRCPRMDVDLSSLAREGQPAPRMGMWIIDRNPPASGNGLTRDQLPKVVGQAFLFGRETDREARLEVVTYQNEEAQAVRSLLAELGQGVLGEPAEEVKTRTPLVVHALAWKWQFPDDMPREQREALMAAERGVVLLEEWPTFKLKVLGGATPQDAARDPAMRVPLLAAILNLELGSLNDPGTVDFNQLRAKLNLPLAQTIDPATIQEVGQVSLARLHRLDMGKLSDDGLLITLSRASHFMQVPALRLAANEALKRPSLEAKLPRQEVYGLLAQIESDPAQAVKYVEEARTAAEAAGQSSAVWDITEMTLRLSMGDFPAAERLMQHVRDEHIREPGIAQMLFQVLVQAGVVNPDGTPTMAARAAGGAAPMGAPAQAAASEKLWTPDAPATPPGGKKSVIWTPD